MHKQLGRRRGGAAESPLPQRPLPPTACTDGFVLEMGRGKFLLSFPGLPCRFPRSALPPRVRPARPCSPRSRRSLPHSAALGRRLVKGAPSAGKPGDSACAVCGCHLASFKYNSLLFHVVVSGRWWRSPISWERGESLPRPLCGYVTGNPFCSAFCYIPQPRQVPLRSA